VRARFPHAPSESLDLLEKMLRFSPRQRIIVDVALQHPLFTDIRDASLETVAPSPVSLDFDSEPDLGESALRKGFGEEIAKFHTATTTEQSMCTLS